MKTNKQTDRLYCVDQIKTTRALAYISTLNCENNNYAIITTPTTVATNMVSKVKIYFAELLISVFRVTAISC